MRRLTVVAVTALVVILAIASIAQGSIASSPAQGSTLGIHYQTFTGMDFHTLDSDDVVRFASETGGGVWLKVRTLVGYAYLEAGVGLPDGATVAEVTFYVRNCETFLPNLYFGAYNPPAGTFTYYIPQFAPPTAACDQTQSIVQPVNPTVTVDNSQLRYVIGFKPGVLYNTGTYTSNFVKSLLVGAGVAYQMPGVFMPLVQR